MLSARVAGVGLLLLLAVADRVAGFLAVETQTLGDALPTSDRRPGRGYRGQVHRVADRGRLLIVLGFVRVGRGPSILPESLAVALRVSGHRAFLLDPVLIAHAVPERKCAPLTLLPIPDNRPSHSAATPLSMGQTEIGYYYSSVYAGVPVNNRHRRRLEPAWYHSHLS